VHEDKIIFTMNMHKCNSKYVQYNDVPEVQIYKN